MEPNTFRAITGESAFEVGLAMDIGSRSTQQDFAIVEGSIFAVFDGAGGEGDGAEASEIAASALVDLYRPHPGVLCVYPSLEDAVLFVHEQLIRIRKDPDSITTIVAVSVQEHAIEVVWIGDSRVYILLQNGDFVQATQDHGENGYLSRALGDKDHQPETRRYSRCAWQRTELEPVRVLLTSDGIHGALDRDEMSQILGSALDVDDMASELVSRAVKRGQHDRSADNATALIINLF